MGDTMKPGDSLHVGAQLQSANGKYRLVMQGDGNLVLYQPEGAVWDTGTYKLPPVLRPTRFDFQTDGNLVLYNQFNYVGWSPNIWGKGGTRLVLQDDRNLVVYRADDTPVWDSHTGVPQPGSGAQEVVHREVAEVGWAKKMTTEAKLFRDGSLMVTTKCECGAPFSGFRGTVLVVAVDDRSRVIWASQTLRCQTACAVLDPSCASFSTTHFTEKWPDVVGQMAVRLDIFQAENVIYDQMRKAIRETLNTFKELAGVLGAWV